MVKLFLVLCCLSIGCFNWSDAFFFNFQKSYVSQPTQANSHTTVSQNADFGLSGIISKWLKFNRVIANNLLGTTTERPGKTQRPVIQIDPIYVPVDLSKEEGSTTTTEFPAEPIESSTKRRTTRKASTTSGTTTTFGYEFTEPSTTERITTTGRTTRKATTTAGTTTTFSYEFTEPSTTERATTTGRTTTTTSYEYPEPSTSTVKITTYRPASTERITTSTTENVNEIDTGEEEKSNEIIGPSSTTTTSTSTSTTTEGSNIGEEVTKEKIPSWTYLPPLLPRHPSATSASSISASVIAGNTISANTKPFDIITVNGGGGGFGTGLVQGAISSVATSIDINPRVFY